VELDLENYDVVCYMLFLNIESSSQCPKMFSEYLEEEFIDHVANSVYEFFRRRA